MDKEQLQFQVNSAILVCEGRISNGAELVAAFKWLQEEIDQIFEGIMIYDEHE